MRIRIDRPTDVDVNVYTGEVTYNGRPFKYAVCAGKEYDLKSFVWLAATGELLERGKVKRTNLRDKSIGCDNLYVPIVYRDPKRAEKVAADAIIRKAENAKVKREGQTDDVSHIKPPDISERRMVEWCANLYHQLEGQTPAQLAISRREMASQPHLYYFPEVDEVINDIISGRV